MNRPSGPLPPSSSAAQWFFATERQRTIPDVPYSSSDLDRLLGHDFLQHNSMAFGVCMFFSIIMFHLTHSAVPALYHLLDFFFVSCLLTPFPIILPRILPFIRAGRRKCPVQCCGGGVRACILARREIIVTITLGKVPPFWNAGACLAVFCIDASHAHRMSWTLWRGSCHRRRLEERAWGGAASEQCQEETVKPAHQCVKAKCEANSVLQV